MTGYIPAPSTNELGFGRFVANFDQPDLSDPLASWAEVGDNTTGALVDPANATVIQVPARGLYLIHATFDLDGPVDMQGIVQVIGSWLGTNYSGAVNGSATASERPITVSGLAYFDSDDPTNFIAVGMQLDTAPTSTIFTAVEIEVTKLGTILPVTAPPGPPAPSFIDTFDRTNRPLAGDNGWFRSQPGNVADLRIVSNVLTVPAGAAPAFGNAPILHPRIDADTNQPDVSVTTTRVDTTGMSGLYVVSDDTFNFALGIEWDASVQAGGPQLDIITGGAGGPSSWDTIHAPWAAFTGGADTIVRLTYNETTKNLEVYQNGVHIATVNVQAALDAYYGPGVVVFPHVSSVVNAGVMSNADVNIDTFNDFASA